MTYLHGWRRAEYLRYIRRTIVETQMVQPFARTCLIVVFLASGGRCGLAEEASQPPIAQEIALTGVGITDDRLTLQKLSALPAVEKEVSFMTSKGEQKGRFRGPLVWTVLRDIGQFASSADHSELKRTFAVVGSDDYEIVF